MHWRTLKRIGLISKLFFGLAFIAMLWMSIFAFFQWFEDLLPFTHGWTPLDWIPTVTGLAIGIATLATVVFAAITLTSLEVSDRKRYPQPVLVRLFLASPTASRSE